MDLKTYWKVLIHQIAAADIKERLPGKAQIKHKIINSGLNFHYGCSKS